MNRPDQYADGIAEVISSERGRERSIPVDSRATANDGCDNCGRTVTEGVKVLLESDDGTSQELSSTAVAMVERMFSEDRERDDLRSRRTPMVRDLGILLFGRGGSGLFLAIAGDVSLL